jgi:hypothetical protein
LLGQEPRDLIIIIIIIIILLLFVGALSRGCATCLLQTLLLAGVFQVTACKQMLSSIGVSLCILRNSSYLEGEKENKWAGLSRAARKQCGCRGND